jgi:hypothetical protein
MGYEGLEFQGSDCCCLHLARNYLKRKSKIDVVLRIRVYPGSELSIPDPNFSSPDPGIRIRNKTFKNF